MEYAGTKKSVSLELDSKLVEDAESLAVDMPRLVERALEREIASRTGGRSRDEAARRWREENAEAITRNNDRIARDGLWADDYRRF